MANVEIVRPAPAYKLSLSAQEAQLLYDLVNNTQGNDFRPIWQALYDAGLRGSKCSTS